MIALPVNRDLCPHCRQPVALYQQTIPAQTLVYRCAQHGVVWPIRLLASSAPMVADEDDA